MKPNRLSMEFGRRLRRLRTDAGFSQERFAKLARLAQNHLSKLERGERLPSFHTMRRLAKALPAEGVLELVSL